MSYNSFGELSTYQANYSGSPLLGVTYTRDALGRITQKAETIGGTTTTTVYGYDPGGRLTDVSVDGSLAAHYEYDGNGNRLAVTRPGTGTVSGTYDAQDRLVAYGAVSYTYTANGDLETATSGGQTTTYNYDVFGNLTAVTLPNATQIEYLIDGQNRRVGKKVNGTLVQGFLYSGQLRPVVELDGSGTVVSRFVYGTKVNVPEYMVNGGVTYRLLTDHLGSVRLVVDTITGTVAQRIDYDEFGQITLDTNPGFQPFGFAGGVYDQHTGLTRFGARDYDAFTGRWTTKDPIRALGGMNFYLYVGADPIVGGDPFGLLDPKCAQCPSGKWSVAEYPNASLAVVKGKQVALMSFTCVDNGMQCVGTVSCTIRGPLYVGAGIGVGGGQVTMAPTGASLGGFSAGYVFSLGFVSSGVTISESGSAQSSIGISKSWGGGVSGIDCETTILGCVR